MPKTRKSTAPTRALLAEVPQEEWDNLRRFQKEVSQIRGWTPLEERKCINSYYQTITYLKEHYGISYIQQALYLGLSEHTIRMWMKRHTEGKTPPSQSRYGHVDSTKMKIDREYVTLRPGGTCRNGHLLTAEDIGLAKKDDPSKGQACLTCREIRRKKSYENFKVRKKAAHG